MNASASVQSIENSMDIDSKMASLSADANNSRSNYMDQLNSAEADANSAAADALGKLNNMSDLTLEQPDRLISIFSVMKITSWLMLPTATDLMTELSQH